MTFTVDDLVSSFNSGGHIGQEAIDIANLQAQLAQTLAYAQQQQQQQQQQFQTSSHKLCNTPTTARTPTTSFGNWSAFEQQQHRARSRSASVAGGEGGGGMDTVEEDDYEMEMDEDEELAVEQLIAPSSHSHALTQNHQGQVAPVRCRGRGDSFRGAQQHHGYGQHNNPSFSHPPASPPHVRHPSIDPMALSECGSPVSPRSSFSSDPFFATAAAAAAAESQTHSSSFFAQIGKPSQHSPFFAAAQKKNGSGIAATTTTPNQFNVQPRFVPTGMFDS